MPTRCILFRFNNNPKIDTLLNDCQEMVAKTVNYALENKKTATFTLINALYPNFREKFPHLHSLWVQSSIMAGAAIVHSFKNRKRKKRAKESPEIKRAFVYVSKEMLKFDFDGETLKIAFPLSPRDHYPIFLTFRPHHKYRHFLHAINEGKANLCEPTLTKTSICIPLKFPKPNPL